MSHGSIEKCEPNLTPLLDLVLQMIMFFMLCGNFASEDIDAKVKLPSAIQAKPMDKTEDYVIFLNVDKFRDKDGKPIMDARWRCTTRGREFTNAQQVLNFLKDAKVIDERRIEANRERKKEPGRISLVVLRGDERCSFKEIAQILDACRTVGYVDVQLRAQVRAGK